MLGVLNREPTLGRDEGGWCPERDAVYGLDLLIYREAGFQLCAVFRNDVLFHTSGKC